MAATKDEQLAPGPEAGMQGQGTPYIGWAPYTHYGIPLNQAFWNGFVEIKQEGPEYV